MAAIRHFSKQERAAEMAEFFGTDEAGCLALLDRGFLALHQAVTDDFRQASPQTDEALLDWYRSTAAYIWELTAYHLDAGFNYEGFCNGIIDGLLQRKAKRVLVLGDGIGDLSIWMSLNDLFPTYHDLARSQTAAFAKAIASFRGAAFCPNLSNGWEPELESAGPYDAVVACDFLEHCPNVEDWVRSIYAVTEPGGVLFAQNAFACGSGENGPMPMHLARNDRFEKDWDPMLMELGFQQESSNWYRKSGGVA
jgi:SAM-dependent methyltransferase